MTHGAALDLPAHHAQLQLKGDLAGASLADQRHACSQRRIAAQIAVKDRHRSIGVERGQRADHWHQPEAIQMNIKDRLALIGTGLERIEQGQQGHARVWRVGQRAAAGDQPVIVIEGHLVAQGGRRHRDRLAGEGQVDGEILRASREHVRAKQLIQQAVGEVGRADREGQPARHGGHATLRQDRRDSVGDPGDAKDGRMVTSRGGVEGRTAARATVHEQQATARALGDKARHEALDVADRADRCMAHAAQPGDPREARQDLLLIQPRQLQTHRLQALLVEGRAQVFHHKNLSSVGERRDHSLTGIAIAGVDHRPGSDILALLTTTVHRRTHGSQADNMGEPVHRIHGTVFQPADDQHRVGMQAHERLHLALDPREVTGAHCRHAHRIV